MRHTDKLMMGLMIVSWMIIITPALFLGGCPSSDRLISTEATINWSGN